MNVIDDEIEAVDDDWERANATYLSKSLDWLRARLEAAADHGATATTARRSHLPRPPKAEPAPAIVSLAAHFALSAFETDVLFLCVAMELDTQIANLCGRVLDDPERRYPTFALAFSVFAEPSWDIVSRQRPLLSWHLIELLRSGPSPLTMSPLRIDPRILNVVKGLNALDERLADTIAPIDDRTDATAQAPSVTANMRRLANYWRRDPLPAAIAVLAGADPSSARRIALDAARDIGVRLYGIDATTLPRAASDLNVLARLWQRETQLLRLALYADLSDAGHEAADGTTLARFAARAGGLICASVREPSASLGSDSFVIACGRPTATEQQALWATALGPSDDGLSVRLPGQFDLAGEQIAQIAAANVARADDTTLAARIWNDCRAALHPRLDSIAQRIDAKATFDDIVLPAEHTAALESIVDQVRHRQTVYQTWGFGAKMSRGLGISALFAGDPGVGKTMAAEVIANALRLDLYRIDLSAVVNKYIGETEKNLGRLFDAADAGGAILFFDEADALFGKRSEVHDSHDRYANIEVNYLLTRMESFRGIAILATNAKAALDAAFVRRLRFIVTFPYPSAGDRARMWERAFPTGTLAGPLDIGRLARFNLTGAGIHNTALNAAFLAARDAAPIGMQHVLAAARAEYLKADRPINEHDFRFVASAAAASA